MLYMCVCVCVCVCMHVFELLFVLYLQVFITFPPYCKYVCMYRQYMYSTCTYTLYF